MRVPTAFGLAVCAWLAAASEAKSATVTMTLDSDGYENVVRYVAAAGERNKLHVDHAGASVTLTDAGAILVVGTTDGARGACESLGPHAAICRVTYSFDPAVPASPYVGGLVAVLRDGNDRISSRGFPVNGFLEVDGGPGRDRLSGDAGADTLKGGAGRDRIDGRGGWDVVRGGRGRDVLNGGADLDELSYSERKHAVFVDLSDGGTGGASGERDRVRGFERATGGRGDDRLAGDAGDNWLNGGPGRNMLVGRGGRDFLRNASGSSVSCGGGSDNLSRPRSSTFVPRACERLVIVPPAGHEFDGDASLTPNPVRNDGRLGIWVKCPEIDGYPELCSALVRVREAAGGRLLASASAPVIESEFPEDRFRPLRFTQLGRQQMDAVGRVRARVTVRGQLLTPTAWTVSF